MTDIKLLPIWYPKPNFLDIRRIDFRCPQ